MKRMLRLPALLTALVMLAVSVPASAFAAGKKEVIERVEITGYVEPAIGAEVITAEDLTVPDGAHYEVSKLFYGKYYPIYAESFEAGSYYDANFEVLSTDRDHVFDETTVVTVNGVEIDSPTDEECYELGFELKNGYLGTPVSGTDFQGYVRPEKGMPAKAELTSSDPDVKVLYSYWEQSGSDSSARRLAEDETFEYGEYQLVAAVELNPEKPLYIEGSTFWGTLNGEKADSYISGTDDFKHSAVVFDHILVGEPVKDYEITGFEIPEAGKPCTSAVELTGNEHCRASGTWLDVDTGSRLGSSDVFSCDKGYIFELTLTCDDGYVLDASPLISLNDSAQSRNIMESVYERSGNSYVFRSCGLDFRETADTADILGVTVPKAGEANSTRAYTLPGQHCHVSDIFWYCRTDGRKMQPGEKFEAGKCYYLSVDVTADDGYAFAWFDTTASINEGRIPVNYLTSSAEGKYCHYESFDFDFSAPQSAVRLAGDDRTGTAVEISKAGFPGGAESVVIASGDGFADALAGVPLAYAMDAPILLVRGDAPDAGTLGEIKRLGAKDIVILGGENAVSANAEKQFSALGNVTRIAGADRFETSALIAGKLYELKGRPREVFFACSNNYPDALAAGSPAALENAPILYMAQNGSLSAPVRKYLDDAGIFRAVILGGEGAISADAEKTLAGAGIPDPRRIFGEDRYDTCLEIISCFGTLFDPERICMATGTNYPDALAGGVFAAKNLAPVILTGDALSTGQHPFLEYRTFDEGLYVFGGANAVSDAMVNQLAAAGDYPSFY